MFAKWAAVLLAVVATLGSAVPAAAQFRWPVQVEAAANDQRYGELLAATEAVRSGANVLGDSTAAEKSVLLVDYVRDAYGADSALYLHELEAYSRDLVGERATEARLLYPEIIALNAKLHGEDSDQFGMAHLGYSRVLAMTGRNEEAAAARLVAFEWQLQDVLNCGRISGNLILGCRENEPLFERSITSVAGSLQQAGRGGEVPALLDRVQARLEEKWAECDGPRWRFDCEKVLEYREDISGALASYYASYGPKDRALPLRQAIFDSRVARFEPCLRADGQYCSNFRVRSSWRSLDRALETETLTDQRLSALETILELTATESGWAKHLQGDTDSVNRQEQDEIDAVVEGMELYSELALANNARDRAQAFLAGIGGDAVLEATGNDSALDARLAELEDERWMVARSSPEYLANRQAVLDVTTQRFGEASNEQFSALRDVFWALEARERNDEAIALIREGLATFREADGDDHSRTYMLLENLIDALGEIGDEEGALAALEDMLGSEANRKDALFEDRIAYRRDTQLSFGDKYDRFSALNTKRAQLALVAGQPAADVVGAARSAVAATRAYRDSLGFDESDQKLYEIALRGDGFLTAQISPSVKYSLLADTLWEAGERDGPAAEEAFLALQDAMVSSVTLAAGRVAAEQLVAQAGLSSLLEERASAGTAVSGAQDYNARARANDRQAEIDVALRNAAPAFFALIRPTALSLGETRALLQPGEAVVLQYPGARGTHIIAVTPDEVAWHRSEWRAEEIEAAVSQLRRDLDPAGSGVPKPWSYFYDRTAAYELYREVFEPMMDVLGETEELYIAPGGSLSRLPPSVLITAPPEGDDEDLAALRDSAWLINRFALVQLPSVQTLGFLRVRTQAPGEWSDTLAAFGDPVLEGEAATRGGLDGGRFATGGNAMRGSLADVQELSQLARLPGTATELRAITAALDAPARALRLAKDATETQVKRADMSRTRVIAFATHGLLAGEIEGLSEPGLVFTPPASASEMDDGLLTSSEIAQMDLAAEWVLLSACNTAAGENAGAEGLTGLAKSFFYAGARSLLASHWPVRDDLAAVLSSDTVSLAISDKGLSRAEALRRTMIAVRGDPDDNTAAHPASWAPFMLVGDGR